MLKFDYLPIYLNRKAKRQAQANARYNIFYDTPNGKMTYCMADMDKTTALDMLRKSKDHYLDSNGKGKRYPNKKGYYAISNVRIEKV